MRHDFDIFEKFRDGSTLWRACVSGWYEAEREMQVLAGRSKSEFYAIDVQANEVVAPSVKRASRAAA
jgi:hypothetical protein